MTCGRLLLVFLDQKSTNYWLRRVTCTVDCCDLITVRVSGTAEMVKVPSMNRHSETCQSATWRNALGWMPTSKWNGHGR
jgi:hypothetical protein